MNNIRIDREYLLSEKLKANLTKLASKYYPSGVIEIGGTYMGDMRLCSYIPDDLEYGALNMTIIRGNIATVGDVMKKDTNPKARAFIDAFYKAKANTEAKKSAPVQQAPSQEIQIINGSIIPKVLLDKITTIAKNYYPRGILTIGKLERENARRFNYFHTDKNIEPPVKIVSQLDNIVDFGALFPEDESHPAIVEMLNSLRDKAKPETQLPTKPVQAPAQQAPTQSIPKNFRRIDGSKRKLYHVEGSHFYPPYVAVMVAIGDSPQNSEIYTEDGGKFYLGVKRYNHMKQGERAGLNVAPINPNNPASKMALAYYKIALV